MATPKYLDTPAASAYSGLSTAYFEKARCRNQGPPTLKIGSRVLYEVSALDAWLLSHERSPTSDPGVQEQAADPGDA